MNYFNKKYNKYRIEVESILNSVVTKESPKDLYKPIKYILNSGGKKFRPILTLFVCEAFGGKYKDALFAAASIEMLHTFTLVHDDIMDNADTRRGRQTIHKKWNIDTAILVGDQLVGLSYQYLLKTKHPDIKRILECFTNGIINVCEGQALDKEFETRTDISTAEYLLMIEKKTAKLLEVSAEIGAIIANVKNKAYLESIKKFANNLGLAFQLQDDLLDIIAEEKEFGKTIGGDIRQGKRTFLLIKALESAKDKDDKEKLHNIISSKYKPDEISQNFISQIKDIYIKYKIIDLCVLFIKNYVKSANESLEIIKKQKGFDLLRRFSNMLLERKY